MRKNTITMINVCEAFILPSELLCVILYGMAGAKIYTTGHCISRTLSYPENTTHLPNVWPVLAHRLRRWPNIGQTLSRCAVFPGYKSTIFLHKILVIPSVYRLWAFYEQALRWRHQQRIHIKDKYYWHQPSNSLIITGPILNENWGDLGL